MQPVSTAEVNDGFFFKFKDNGRTVAYALGTAHSVEDLSLVQLNGSIYKALNKATCVGFEILPPDLEQLFFKDNEIDNKVMWMALKKGRPLVALEKNSEKHYGIIAEIEAFLERENLPLVLNSTPTKKMESTWKKGDFKNLVEDSQAMPWRLINQEGYALSKRLVSKRNVEIAETSLELIEQGEKPFLCFGMAHLPDIPRDKRVDPKESPLKGVLSLIGQHFPYAQVFHSKKISKGDVRGESKGEEVVQDLKAEELKPCEGGAIEQVQSIAKEPHDCLEKLEGLFVSLTDGIRSIVILPSHFSEKDLNGQVIKDSGYECITPLIDASSTDVLRNLFEERLEKELAAQGRDLSEGSNFVSSMNAELKMKAYSKAIKVACLEGNEDEVKRLAGEQMCFIVSSLQGILAEDAMKELIKLMEEIQQELCKKTAEEIANQLLDSGLKGPLFFRVPIQFLFGMQASFGEGISFEVGGIVDQFKNNESEGLLGL